MIWDLYIGLQCYNKPFRVDGGWCTNGSLGEEIFDPSEYFFEWIDSIAARGAIWTFVLLNCAYHYMWQRHNPNKTQWTADDWERNELNRLVPTWPGLGGTGVTFLKDYERLHHRVWKTTDGMLGWKYDPFRGDGELLDTTQGQTAFGTQGFIWTLNEDKEFYTTPQQVGRLHHSTLTAGAPVLAAGEWVVKMGKLLMISGQTGHYKTPMRALYTAATHISMKFGIPPEAYNVKLFKKQGHGVPQQEVMWAKAFTWGYFNNPVKWENEYQVFGR